MLFSSATFLMAFLPITLLLYFSVTKRLKNSIRIKNLILLISSLIFYGWGEPKYILVMIGSMIFNYILAILIGESAKNNSAKSPNKNLVSKMLLSVCILGNLGLLGFFKYTDFVIRTVNGLGGLNLGLLNIALPIGISFYTFQTMSYVIDVYKGKVGVQKDFVIFAAYVALFPQLIAGPIVRYSDVEIQLGSRVSSEEKIDEGIRRFVIGLGKKVILANQVAVVWEYILKYISQEGQVSLMTAWLGAICFTFQIYFDFSGYSDMAIGLGKIFGFDYLENFNYPYISGSITEFWRRWHISLSSWFKEYVYIPLGGNKKGLLRQILNIGIVWALTGLWHGASWNFVLWGLYYGLILIIEKSFLLKFLEKHKVIGHIYTIILIVTGWVLFALDDLSQVINYLGLMFNVNNPLIDEIFIYYGNTRLWLIIACIIGATPIIKKLSFSVEENLCKKPILFSFISTLVFLGIFLVSLSFLVIGSYNPFLYFRF